MKTPSGARSSSFNELTDQALLHALLELRGSTAAARPALQAGCSVSEQTGLPLAEILSMSNTARQRAFGAANAHKLAVAIELAGRIARVRFPRRAPIVHPADIYAWSKSGLRTREQEELWILAVDRRMALREARMLARGGAAGVGCEVREVLRHALDAGAAGFFLVHNHPAGSLTPSQQDFDFTAAVAIAAGHIGMPLLDHVIVSASGYASICGSSGGWGAKMASTTALHGAHAISSSPLRSSPSGADI
jgi:DNA repair protein RadC